MEDERVIIGSGDGQVYCFSQHGKVLWRTKLGPAASSVTVSDELLEKYREETMQEVLTRLVDLGEEESKGAMSPPMSM